MCDPCRKIMSRTSALVTVFSGACRPGQISMRTPSPAGAALQTRLVGTYFNRLQAVLSFSCEEGREFLA
jgi:hypothetical protein